MHAVTAANCVAHLRGKTKSFVLNMAKQGKLSRGKRVKLWASGIKILLDIAQDLAEGCWMFYSRTWTVCVHLWICTTLGLINFRFWLFLLVLGDLNNQWFYDAFSFNGKLLHPMSPIHNPSTINLNVNLYYPFQPKQVLTAVPADITLIHAYLTDTFLSELFAQDHLIKSARPWEIGTLS